MRYLQAFFQCLSMFSGIPCPHLSWREELRPEMTALLGLVGLVIGSLWAGVALVCQSLALSPLLTGGILTVTPWFLSGFIHLDGFMDCCDALLSRRDLEGRLRILKDPTCGAFSVIALVSLVLVTFSALAGEEISLPWGLLWVATLPRCCSALAVLALPSLSSSQYQQLPRQGSMIALATVLLLAGVLAGFLYHPAVFVTCLACLVGWSCGCLAGYRSFGGMSGDISGYAITLGEAWGLVTLALFS